MYFGREMFVPLTDPVRQREVFRDTVSGSRSKPIPTATAAATIART